MYCILYLDVHSGIDIGIMSWHNLCISDRPRCPLVLCARPCPNGVILDRNGCSTCRCSKLNSFTHLPSLSLTAVLSFDSIFGNDCRTSSMQTCSLQTRLSQWLRHRQVRLQSLSMQYVSYNAIFSDSKFRQYLVLTRLQNREYVLPSLADSTAQMDS